jgi:hypothetical protein
MAGRISLNMVSLLGSESIPSLRAAKRRSQ